MKKLPDESQRVPSEKALAAAFERRSESLLRVHHFRLRRADLEECLGRSVLELLIAVRNGQVFASREHAEVALETRFLSRVTDHHRAVAGRSPMRAALERALDVDTHGDIPGGDDFFDDGDPIGAGRERLARITAESARLSPAERLVIGTQLGIPIDPASVCSATGWSRAKYRKTAQRAHEALRTAVAA